MADAHGTPTLSQYWWGLTARARGLLVGGAVALAVVTVVLIAVAASTGGKRNGFNDPQMQADGIAAMRAAVQATYGTLAIQPSDNSVLADARTTCDAIQRDGEATARSEFADAMVDVALQYFCP